jgi:hypothetical protein
LARELTLPLVAKDTIKDALMSVLPTLDADASMQLGRAATPAISMRPVPSMSCGAMK